MFTQKNQYMHIDSSSTNNQRKLGMTAVAFTGRMGPQTGTSTRWNIPQQ